MKTLESLLSEIEQKAKNAKVKWFDEDGTFHNEAQNALTGGTQLPQGRGDVHGLANRIVKAIIADLEGRKGVGDELEQIEQSVRKEMIGELVGVVKPFLSSSAAMPSTQAGWISFEERPPTTNDADDRGMVFWHDPRYATNVGFWHSPMSYHYWMPIPALPNSSSATEPAQAGLSPEAKTVLALVKAVRRAVQFIEYVPPDRWDAGDKCLADVTRILESERI